MEIIEPFDEIQVFVVGTGDCLWGRIQPESRYHRNKGACGGIILELTINPLADTVRRLRGAGVVFRDPISGPPLGRHEQMIGNHVRIPSRLVDVVFGDDRHVV